MPVQSGPLQAERTRAYAEKFLDEMRADIERTSAAGLDCLPRLRSVHERSGHATPEFRTLVIPLPPGVSGVSPDLLSATIAYFAARRTPDRLVLAMDALHTDGADEPRPVLIAEARDAVGTRLFWMQGYRREGRSVRWEPPRGGGWTDPGDETMVLDAAFQPAG